MRGLSEGTIELIAYVRKLLGDNYPQTLRQLHYAIFSRKEIEYNNTQADYKRLSRATTVARRAYRQWELDTRQIANWRPMPKHGINPAWMVDETRQPETISAWDNLGDYISGIQYRYRRDMWQDQPCFCEIWSEKATILGSIRPITEKWGVTSRVLHGFGSTGMETDTGEFFSGIGKPITIYFLGDHDPSGRVIENDIHQRVMAASGRNFLMLRLAIHEWDIRKFNLPPQRIKATDSRAAGFRREFGKDAPTVELDALPAEELRRRIDEAIYGLIDVGTWNRQVEVQEAEFRSIRDIVSFSKKLPQAEAQL